MKVGFLSVATHKREASIARVRVDGVDVTKLCFAADDIEGWADCFVRDAHGRVMLDADRTNTKKTRLRGDVVIDFPKGLD